MSPEKRPLNANRPPTKKQRAELVQAIVDETESLIQHLGAEKRGVFNHQWAAIEAHLDLASALGLLRSGGLEKNQQNHLRRMLAIYASISTEPPAPGLVELLEEIKTDTADELEQFYTFAAITEDLPASWRAAWADVATLEGRFIKDQSSKGQ